MTCSPIWSWLQKWVGTAVWSLELIYERGAACLPSWAGGESVVGNAEMEKDKRKFSLFNLLTLDLSKKIKALTGSPRSAAAAGNNSDSLPELRKPWTVKSPSCGHFYLSSCGDRSQLFILKLLIKGQKGRIFTRAKSRQTSFLFTLWLLINTAPLLQLKICMFTQVWFPVDR